MFLHTITKQNICWTISSCDLLLSSHLSQLMVYFFHIWLEVHIPIQNIHLHPIEKLFIFLCVFLCLTPDSSVMLFKTSDVYNLSFSHRQNVILVHLKI